MCFSFSFLSTWSTPFSDIEVGVVIMDITGLLSFLGLLSLSVGGPEIFIQLSCKSAAARWDRRSLRSFAAGGCNNSAPVPRCRAGVT